MATQTTKVEVTMDEIAIVENRIADLVRAGKPLSELSCPRCGGDLELTGSRTSHKICCENDDCFEYTVRGI
jgi:hypothetical protein